MHRCILESINTDIAFLGNLKGEVDKLLSNIVYNTGNIGSEFGGKYY